MESEVESFDEKNEETPVLPIMNELKETDPESLLSDPDVEPSEIDYDSIGEFCFESEQLALNGNVDYKNLLEAVVVLESQRAQAKKDLQWLVEMKAKAQEEPFEFLESLKEGRLNFPVSQTFHPLPMVDWSKYAVQEDPLAFSLRQKSICQRKNVSVRRTTAQTEGEFQGAKWASSQLREMLPRFPSEEPESHKGPSQTALKYSEEGERNESGTAKWTEDKMADEEGIFSDWSHTSEFQELKLLEDVMRKRMLGTHQISGRGLQPGTDSTMILPEQFPSVHLESSNVTNKNARSDYKTLDCDYLSFSGRGANYLDPNYLPAT